jgi:hypothetical protein
MLLANTVNSQYTGTNIHTVTLWLMNSASAQCTLNVYMLTYALFYAIVNDSHFRVQALVTFSQRSRLLMSLAGRQ